MMRVESWTERGTPMFTIGWKGGQQDIQQTHSIPMRLYFYQCTILASLFLSPTCQYPRYSTSTRAFPLFLLYICDGAQELGAQIYRRHGAKGQEMGFFYVERRRSCIFFPGKQSRVRSSLEIWKPLILSINLDWFWRFDWFSFTYLHCLPSAIEHTIPESC